MWTSGLFPRKCEQFNTLICMYSPLSLVDYKSRVKIKTRSSVFIAWNGLERWQTLPHPRLWYKDSTIGAQSCSIWLNIWSSDFVAQMKGITGLTVVIPSSKQIHWSMKWHTNWCHRQGLDNLATTRSPLMTVLTVQCIVLKVEFHHCSHFTQNSLCASEK